MWGLRGQVFELAKKQEETKAAEMKKSEAENQNYARQVRPRPPPAWLRPRAPAAPHSHIKNQSCSCLGFVFEVANPSAASYPQH